MLQDKQYYKYFGFTEGEMKDLCNKNKQLCIKNKEKTPLKYKKLKKWYDGYISHHGGKMYNSWSIISALNNNDSHNYWKETGSMDEVKKVINFNINGVRENFLRLVLGDKIKIELNGYSAENKQKRIEKRNRFGKEK